MRDPPDYSGGSQQPIPGGLMKLFMSHSSKHKPLVRELTHYLPDHIVSWIDEKRLLVGDNLTESIKDAIEVGTDFVILFVDLSSATSAWVRKLIVTQVQKLKSTCILIPQELNIPGDVDTASWGDRVVFAK
jgi:hypothetical protein